MALDLAGNITLTFSVVSLFLLVLGLPLIRGVNSFRNLMMHGYATIVALILQTIFVLIVMIPSFISNFDHIVGLPPFDSLDTWLHVGLGIFAEASGAAFIGLWLIYSRSKMRCATAKKYMTPTLIVWAASIVTGALIHILQFF